MVATLEKTTPVDELSQLLGSEERAERFINMFNRVLNDYLANPSEEKTAIRPTTAKNLEKRAGITNPVSLINFFCQVTNLASLKTIAESSAGMNITAIQQQLVVVIMMAHIQAGSEGGDTVENVLITLKKSLENRKSDFVDTKSKNSMLQLALYIYLVSYIEKIQQDQSLLSKFTQHVTPKSIQAAAAV